MVIRRKKHNTKFDRKIKIEHTGFYPYLQDYLEARLLKGYSAETNKRHDSMLRQFIGWCDDRSLNDPKEITKPILELYRKHLFYREKSNGQPLSFSAQHIALSTLRTFFKWLTKENYLLYNPASELELPKRPKKLPHAVLSVEDISSILNEPDIEKEEGIRDRTIMEILYGCGLRRNELIHLSVFDVDLKRKLLVVKGGKGNKDRVLPVGELVLQWLEKYLEDVRPLLLTHQDEITLFLTDYGEAYTGSTLGRMVKKHIKQAGIEITGSCHLFRHSMATHMLENGADIRYIQVMLGHEDLNTTQIYTQVSVEKLREVHKATHPFKASKINEIDGSIH